MRLFRKKSENIVDNRTELEKKFEETGRVIGVKTGETVQKVLDKASGVKQKLEENGTLEKVRQISDQIDDTIDELVEKASVKGKRVVQTVTKKKSID
jgi:hypothetical protein